MEVVRRRARSAALVALILTMISGAVLAQRFWVQSHLPPFGLTVALDATGVPVEVVDPSALLAGTRVLAGGADSERLAAAQRSWLASGTTPRVAELGATTMFGAALLDLDTLSRPHGIAVAGWRQPWRFVWPRDAAFVASALARTGHSRDAVRTLDFLQRVQLADGTFRPRSTADGAGVPDDRSIQYDNTGWAAWALAEVVRPLPPAQARRVLAEHRTLLDRSTGALLRLTEQGTALPPPSPDYWEVPESDVTLASAASLLLGLRSVAAAYRISGGSAEAADLNEFGLDEVALDEVAERYQRVIMDRFADDGFPRHPGGPHSSVDLGVALLMPPFTAAADPRVAAAYRNSTRFMERPAGGLAPGGSWRRDGVSWTNVTATYAMVDSCLADRGAALDRLRWLDRHRTSAGSLPEKVLANGSPAYVAPLAWTSAAVVIAGDQLARGCAPVAAQTQ